jgi:uncharacterized protein YlxP (DUF503 family)
VSDPGGGFVAVLVLDLHFPEAGSLKAKRKDLQSIKAILHGRFGATVAETDHQDLWQRAELTVALAGSSATQLEEAVGHVCRWLDARCPDGVGMERMFASTADLRDVMSTLRLDG